MSSSLLRRLAFRALAVALCVFALTNPRLLGGGTDDRPVVLLDVSASVGGAGAGLPEGLQVRPYWILVADGVQDVVGGSERVRVRPTGTTLGRALRHAGARYPGADLLLVSDGRGTDGDALAAATAVRVAGGRVFTTPPAAPRADVGLLAARLAWSAQTAIIRAELESSTSGVVDVRLARGGQNADLQTVAVAPGSRHLVELRDTLPPAGGATYVVSLAPRAGTPDDDAGDNRLSVGMRPEERVILRWGFSEGDALPAPPGTLVRSTQDLDGAALQGVDCLVMCNVPWHDIGRGTTRDLGRFVAGGGRLLILGGPDAYAGGGWAGTAFEEGLAPLRVPRREGVGLALGVALDRSGSTQGAPLAHLKDAARRVVLGLARGERVGVLPFAGEPAAALLGPGLLSWGAPDGQDAVLAAIDELEAQGSTDLPAAIRAAARHVAAVEARERRVILLTDGDPEHPPDGAALDEAARYLEERGVALAAFVVGDATSARRLEQAFAPSGGTVSLLADASEIPLRLLHEIGGLRGRQERLPAPARLRIAPGARPPFSVDGFLPRALQHVEVAGDAGATLLLSADYDELRPATVPFAASRVVGAGVVGALAWGPDLERGAARAAALARLGPWIADLASAADRGLAADIEGEVLVVRVPSAAGAGSLTARGPVGTVRLLESAPGVFRGPLPREAEAGVQVETPAGPRPLRLPSRPDPEHRGVGVDEARLRAIAAAGGGERLAAGRQPPAPEGRPGPPLAPWLLLLACILLVVDRARAKGRGGTADLPVAGSPS